MKLIILGVLFALILFVPTILLFNQINTYNKLVDKHNFDVTILNEKIDNLLDENEGLQIRYDKSKRDNFDYVNLIKEYYNNETEYLREYYEELMIQYDNYFKLLTENRCEIYYAYERQYHKKPLVDGLHWTGTDFYCVWTKDRPLDKIQETEYHEHCHYLVEQDYEHFCR